MKPSQEATRVWIAGKPLRPHQTKPNAERLGGARAASATPTSLGPAGLAATIGPPLSPAQTVLWMGRLRFFPLIFRTAASPERPPASQMMELGPGQKRCTKTVAALSWPIFALRWGDGLLDPKPATESAARGLVNAKSSEGLASWIGETPVGVRRVSTARSPKKPCDHPGLIAAALTAWTSPPAKAAVELARTVIVGGLETQCAAVSTLVGESTDPVQSVCGVTTETMKGQSEMLARVPPTTLALARGPLAAAGPAAADMSNPAQISAITTLAVRDRITTLIRGNRSSA
jgi:hypothetical protein